MSVFMKGSDTRDIRTGDVGNRFRPVFFFIRIHSGEHGRGWCRVSQQTIGPDARLVSCNFLAFRDLEENEGRGRSCSGMCLDQDHPRDTFRGFLHMDQALQPWCGRLIRFVPWGTFPAGYVYLPRKRVIFLNRRSPASTARSGGLCCDGR